MGRRVNQAEITTKNARKGLPIRKPPHWRAIDRGAHIGYRKGFDGGTWVGRYRRPDGTYVTKAFGAADDKLKANGRKILDHTQALRKIGEWCEDQGSPSSAEGHGGPSPASPYTVGDAIADYLAWYARHRKALYEVTRRANVDILPKLGSIPVDEINARTIRRWHENLAASPPRLRSAKHGPQRAREMPTDPEGLRKRRATANKTLIILKAALNRAFEEDSAAKDDAWRKVKPFRGVDAARVEYLSVEDATRLTNACDPDFRNLVRGALYTGARYGELTATEVSDFDIDNGKLFFRFTKSGKPRHANLTDEGCAFFTRLTMGRKAGERMFLRSDGEPWRKSHQHRRLAKACAIAKIDPPISFHILRHTFGSWLAMRGVALQVIADALGHADTRITHRHYAALSPSYIADTIRAALPDLGIQEDGAVVGLRPGRAK